MGQTPHPLKPKESAGESRLTNLDRARKLKLLLEANPALSSAQLEVAAGEYLVRQGDSDPAGLPYAYLVFDGEVEERQSHFYPGIGNKEITVFRVPEGGIAFSQALYPVYARMPAVTSVVAVTDALVFMLRNENLVDLYKRDPELFQLIKVEYQMRMQVLSTMNEMAKLYELNHLATELVKQARPFLQEHGWDIGRLMEVVENRTKRIDEAMAHAADANAKSAEALMELEVERERWRYRWLGAEMVLDRHHREKKVLISVIERLGIDPDSLGIGRQSLEMTVAEKTLLQADSLDELRAVKSGLPKPRRHALEDVNDAELDKAIAAALAPTTTRLLRQSLQPARPSVRVGSSPPAAMEELDDADDPGRTTEMFDVLPPSVGTPHVPPSEAPPKGLPLAKIGLVESPFDREPPTAVRRPRAPKLDLDLSELATESSPSVPPEPFQLEEAPTLPSEEKRQRFDCPPPTRPGAYRHMAGDPGTTTASMDAVVLPKEKT